jgi:hypothetical protein
MESWVRNKWVIGGVACLLILGLPMRAFSQKAAIHDVQGKGANGAWKVSFSVENRFPEKMQEAIQTGIPTTIIFYLQLYQVRNWWRDQRLASLQFQHTIQYSPIRREYQVTFEEKGTSRVTQNFEEAKGWMVRIQDVEIKSPSEVKPDVLTYLRIKAEMDPVKLPLHLEYLLFFVSLWNFETDWHVEPLSP